MSSNNSNSYTWLTGTYAEALYYDSSSTTKVVPFMTVDEYQAENFRSLLDLDPSVKIY